MRMCVVSQEHMRAYQGPILNSSYNLVPAFVLIKVALIIGSWDHEIYSYPDMIWVIFGSFQIHH